MDDDLEDLYFVQFYQCMMKVVSRFSLTNPFSGGSQYFAYLWRLIRVYLFKPEVLLATVILFVFLIYLHAAEEWSKTFISSLRAGFGLKRSTMGKVSGFSTSPAERESWEHCKHVSAVYAVQGRRPNMEDRFVIDENINNDTGISFFAIFDGHGGSYAAEFAKDILVQNLYNKIVESSNIVKGKTTSEKVSINNNNNIEEVEEKCETPRKEEEKKEDPLASISSPNATQRRKSFKKSMSKDDDDSKNNGNQISDPDILSKMNLNRPITKDNFFQPNKSFKAPPRPKVYEAKCYVDKNVINFGKLVTDEVLAADYKLVETAKKNTDIAGTTALIAIFQENKLTVANVGDSRGVMCDHKGNAIPLSFDHKPQQVREHKRIHDAGGFIAFRGVWRVAGILATSRALGDYPLKDRNLVIADPDILSFDLNYHKPQFIILASDGLWDTFTNEEAVAYIKEHLDEPHFGAKSICLQSYARGSLDNITVMVIVFKNGHYQIGVSTKKED